jgi:hypothetical protein
VSLKKAIGSQPSALGKKQVPHPRFARVRNDKTKVKSARKPRR